MKDLLRKIESYNKKVITPEEHMEVNNLIGDLLQAFGEIEIVPEKELVEE